MSKAYSVWCSTDPARRAQITSRQKTSYTGHTATGGRYALCPDCGHKGPRQIVFEGDALQFWCPKCEKTQTSCALPTENLELRDFARGPGDFFDPKGWGHVELEKIKREGCNHPRYRWKKHCAGVYLCSRCGHSWDMALPTRQARQVDTNRVKKVFDSAGPKKLASILAQKREREEALQRANEDRAAEAQKVLRKLPENLTKVLERRPHSPYRDTEPEGTS